MKPNSKLIGERFHIGKKIKEVWKRSGLKATEFARRIHRERQAIYNIFRKESIDTSQLKKICLVLDHDFFKDYSETFHLNCSEPSIHQPLQKLSNSIDQLSSEVKSLANKNSST